MIDSSEAGSLNEVPDGQRRQMVSGMRWTLWLSALSVPFSYGITILLARTSPEAIGTYGLLSVYIGIVLGLFYLGGDAVAIKFVPKLDSGTRFSFLWSYFLIVCVALIPWLTAAFLWPQKLHYLFGGKSSQFLDLLLLTLSPLVIFASLVGAALKGMLEIGWAQIINRCVTIGSFLIYAALFAFARRVLSDFYAPVIWGTYLLLCAVGSAIGLYLLFRLNTWRQTWSLKRFFLPAGFWRYTLSLQQLSALGFFTQRLDSLLIFNFGDLTLLGEYTAMITLAESIRLINRFFTDALLPSLTNVIAAENMPGASAVFRAHKRIFFLTNTGITCGLILLARPVTGLLGARYFGLASYVILLALFVGLSSPMGLAGALLSSIGKQQRAVPAAVVHVATYVGLFIYLWPKWQLAGAVTAYGIAWLTSTLFYWVAAKLNSPFEFSIAREYVAFTVVAGTVAVFARISNLSMLYGLTGLGISMFLFIALARYGIAECREFIQFFLPFDLQQAQSKQ